MPWLISFIVCWIVFFILIDYKTIRRTVAAGVFAIVLQLNVDYHAAIYGLYDIADPIFEILYSSVFFTFGVVPTMGMLFVQYLPRANKWVKLINILVWTSIFLLFEVFVVQAGGLVHIKWSYLNSIAVNTAIFTMLTWLGENFIITKDES